ncbi:hypothetical protein SAMN05428971_2831 [Candidatus Pantoea varia]|uniref:Uncharacterized protein n=1 Tax=Candidatus Pantoea varia TaxID=1881036 RepID=A0A1I5E988_9GAMM|nr:hypothetical protein SAMN05428971_2831 [Pantoea varia]
MRERGCFECKPRMVSCNVGTDYYVKAGWSRKGVLQRPSLASPIQAASCLHEIIRAIKSPAPQTGSQVNLHSLRT